MPHARAVAWVVTVQDKVTGELLHVFGPWKTHDAAEVRAVNLAMALSVRGDLDTFHIDVRRTVHPNAMDSTRIKPILRRPA